MSAGAQQRPDGMGCSGSEALRGVGNKTGPGLEEEWEPIASPAAVSAVGFGRNWTPPGRAKAWTLLVADVLPPQC